MLLKRFESGRRDFSLRLFREAVRYELNGKSLEKSRREAAKWAEKAYAAPVSHNTA